MEWLEYFQGYMKDTFPGFLQQEPWNYKDDLCIVGTDKLYQATKDDRFRAAILAAVPKILSDHGALCSYDFSENNLDKISVGKSLLILYRHTKDEKFLHAALRCYEKLLTNPRTGNGLFVHKDIYPHQVWLDGLYMALPFYAECTALTGNAGFDDIVGQFEAARSRLFVPETRLYIHAWDENRSAEWADKATGLSPSYWLRSMGWFVMALCDVYETAKQRTPHVATLAGLLEEALAGILLYRDAESGMFWQVPDRIGALGNYPETSGSAMVAYALLKGARLGMIAETNRQTGLAVLESVRRRYLTKENGVYRLDGICASAGLGPGPDHRTDRDGSYTYYVSEALQTDNQHGAGACMLAFSEALSAAAE